MFLIIDKIHIKSIEYYLDIQLFLNFFNNNLYMSNLPINDRFVAYCKYKRISQVEVRKLLAVKEKSQVSNWFNSVEPLPMRQVVKATQIFDDLNANWFINGEGEMLNPGTDVSQANEPQTTYNCQECLEKERTINALKEALDAKEELLKMYRENKKNPE